MGLCAIAQPKGLAIALWPHQYLGFLECQVSYPDSLFVVVVCASAEKSAVQPIIGIERNPA